MCTPVWQLCPRREHMVTTPSKRPCRCRKALALPGNSRAVITPCCILLTMGECLRASLDLRGGPDPPSWQEERQIIRDILKTALTSSEILKRVWHIKTYHCLSCDLISLSIYKYHLNMHSYYPDAMSKHVYQVR